MISAVMMDIAILAVIVVFALLGWRRGMFLSLAELAAVVIALVLAFQIAGFAAGALVDGRLRPAAHEAIEDRVDEMLAETVAATSPREEMERVLDAVPNGYLREKALEVLEERALSTAEQAGWSARQTLVDMGCEIVDRALDTVVYKAIHGAVCAVAFAVVLAALKLAIRVLDLAAKLPVLRQLNELGGLLLGAGKGIILAFLAVWLLGRLGLLAEGAMEGSILAGLATRMLGA